MARGIKSKISEILEHDYRGPRPGFSEAHVLKAIVTIGQLATVGRGRLGSLLRLGPGETRTLIRRLKEKNLITVETNGCILTDLGKREYNSISKTLTSFGLVDARFLNIGRYSSCIILRGKSNRVRIGIEQRDAAMFEGANGALTLTYKDGRFRVPTDGTDCERVNPSDLWNTIREKGQLKEGDVVIITSADNQKTAELGGWSAALATI
jgi:hypothetical protein